MKFLSILILASCLSIQAEAQQSKFKALFIYKFIQNIEWPSSKVGNSYVVSVNGNDELKNEIQNLTAGRSVNGRTIVVNSYNGNLQGVNLLFLGNSKSGEIGSLSAKCKSSSVLLVAETPGLARKGAAINFIEAGGRIKFEMNPATLSGSGLKASGSIKSLAILVN